MADKPATRGGSRTSPSKSFTSTKLDLLRCIMADARVTHRDARIAARILQQVDEKNGEAYISDATVIDEIPKLDRWQMNDFRKHMRDIGWLTFERQKRQHATTYAFSTSNINQILDVLDAKREARIEARSEQRIGRPKGSGKSRGQTTTSISGDVVTQPHPDVVTQPPLHLRGSPQTYHSTEGATLIGEATHTRARAPARGSDPILRQALELIGHGDQRLGTHVAADMGHARFTHLLDRVRSSGGDPEDWNALCAAGAEVESRTAGRAAQNDNAGASQ